MFKNRYIILLAYIGIVLCVLVFGMSTYAYISVSLGEEEDPIDIVVYDRNVEVTFIDTSNVSMVNAYTGQKINKTFYIENTSSGVAYYDIVLENVINDFSNKEDLIYTLKSTNGAYVSTRVAPSEDKVLASNIRINANEKHSYELEIEFLQTNEDQSDNMNKTFSSNINIFSSKKLNAGELLYKKDTLLEKIITNSKGNIGIKEYNDLEDGVYYTNNSLNGITTFFYRGSHNLKNNVVIGDKCYKIIRTAENYSIKLIYSGEYNNGCNNELDEKVAYNTLSNFNAYVGFMYGNVSSDNYESEHKNSNSSDIKKYLDVWYNLNLKEYENLVDNETIYCNNRITKKFNYGRTLYNTSGYSNLNTGYLLMYDYMLNNNTINYECDLNDRFSVSNELGNNKLNYSIGLLTIEEAYYAGILPNKNISNNYLVEDYDYITMTPAYYNGQDAYNFVITKDKVTTSKVSNLYNVRPVVSIKKDTKVLSGDGSINNPYILTEIKMKESDNE